MVIRNKSKKIIGVNGEVIMPDDSLELDDEFAGVASIQALVRVGQLEITTPPAPAADVPAESDAKETKPKKSSRSKKSETTEEDESKAVEAELAAKIFN